MLTAMHKSRKMKRYQLVLLIFLLVICSWVLMRYFEMNQAMAEQFMLKSKMVNIIAKLRYEEAFHAGKTRNCDFLNNPRLLGENVDLNLSKLKESHFLTIMNGNRMYYDPQQHRLTYLVGATDYFQSSIGSRIEWDFVCRNGEVNINVSPHQWCTVPRLWGCESYQ